MIFVLLVYALVAIQFGNVLSQSATDPSACCYITISNGTEYCYYCPPSGYQCDYGAQDPTHRNMSACNQLGLCYTLVSGGTEVCYYTAPYGYNCYFEVVQKLIENMTNCDNLKANAPPVIGYTTLTYNADENIELSLADITITDLDAAEGNKEGKGFLQITITTTNALVGFDPTQSFLTTAEQTAANYALTNPKESDGATFTVGNGSFASALTFEARIGPLGALMRTLAYKSAPNYNVIRAPTLYPSASTVTINANDEGNTGGTPEQDTKTFTFTVRAIDNPPIIVLPDQNATNEDTTMAIQGFYIIDVDSDEGDLMSPKNDTKIRVTLSVKKGRLISAQPTGTTFPTIDGKTITYYNTLAVINAALATVQYVPDTYENDETYPGVDNITVVADDLGHTGVVLPALGTTATFTLPLHVIPVNDAPVIFGPAYLVTDEDVALLGLNITVTDVDTATAIKVTLRVSNGVLSCSSPCPIAAFTPNSTISFNATTVNILDITNKLIYTPTKLFNGIDTIVVDADDGQSFNSSAKTKTVDIHVEAVNNPPVFTMSCPTKCTGGNYTETAGQPVVAVNAALNYAGSSDYAPAITVYDPDVGSTWLQLVISAGKGNIKLANTTGIAELNIPRSTTLSTLQSCSGGSAGTCPDLIMFMAPQSVVNTVLAGLTYYRMTAGADMLIVAVNDLQHTGKGKAGTDVIAFDIN